MVYRIFGRDYPQQADAIVIGAGIGGLFCANLLARDGMKVLLLERHYMLGGFCSTFRRKGFLFDAATHFYPMLGNPETLTGRLVRQLGVPTEWIKMDPVDQFHLPGLPAFAVPADFDAYLSKLKTWFPHESASLDAYFAETRQAYLHGLLYYFNGIDSPHLQRWKNLSITDKLDQCFRDERLKILLMADAPHWGSSPARTSYLFDAMLRFAYFLGNYYPRGSSQRFADDLGRVFQEHGGNILKCAAVDRILIRDGRAAGVRVTTVSRRTPESYEFHAPVVVSNADAVHTFRDLVGENHCGAEFLRQLESLTPTLPCFLVHIGLRDMDPAKLEAVEGYYWNSYDPGDMVREVFKIFIPTRYDPRIAPPGCQVLIVQKLMPVPWQQVTDWKAHREQVHSWIMQRLRDMLPDIDRHAVVNLSASALTSYRFTNNWQGAMLGWEMSPEQLGAARPSNLTPIPNLYLTGHWTQPGGGVTPVIVSAQRTAGAILSGKDGWPSSDPNFLAASV